METLINLNLWWVTLIMFLASRQTLKKKKEKNKNKKVHHDAVVAKLMHIIYIPTWNKRKETEINKINKTKIDNSARIWKGFGVNTGGLDECVATVKLWPLNSKHQNPIPSAEPHLHSKS